MHIAEWQKGTQQTGNRGFLCLLVRAQNVMFLLQLLNIRKGKLLKFTVLPHHLNNLIQTYIQRFQILHAFRISFLQKGVQCIQ